MVIDVPYQSLLHTLQSLKLQVWDSLPYMADYIPDSVQTPEQLFKYLKPQLTFRKDPDGDEYIQTVQTLFEKNDGHGDCDCFSTLALASFVYCGFKPMYVALSSNSRLAPTHIYTEVYDPYKHKITAFDLTNPIYNMQRPYKYKQRILFQL